jgi:hypothetical protein
VEEPDIAIINRMRARAAQCRRLAAALTDPQAANALIKMADDVEADIARLEVPNPAPLPPTRA